MTSMRNIWRLGLSYWKDLTSKCRHCRHTSMKSYSPTTLYLWTAPKLKERLVSRTMCRSWQRKNLWKSLMDTRHWTCGLPTTDIPVCTIAAPRELLNHGFKYLSFYPFPSLLSLAHFFLSSRIFVCLACQKENIKWWRRRPFFSWFLYAISLVWLVHM